MSGPVVDIAGLRKAYMIGDRRLEILKGIDLCVRPGEYVAIMGPSGSGKSTLLNIIGLLDSLDSGEYRLAGESVAGLRDRELSRYRNRHIGFIFQGFNLFPQFDILGNVEVPMIYSGRERRERRRRARELAELVGLGDRLHHRPRELSGGEMQRTAIARALSNEPAVLLADEPTGNLDEKTGLEIMAIFDRLVAGGRAIVMVTHNALYRQRAHRVIDIHDGQFLS